MAFVDAIGQTASVFCLCCNKSFTKGELPGHVASDHFRFLPFACTSCDYTAASEREVLEHAKEKRHIPYAVDPSSSKPYLRVLIRLVISHCKTFAQTSDFAEILAELNSQIPAHENAFSGITSQSELTFAETPQHQDAFCLCCSRSFPQAELSGHVASDHVGFLPFACTSCDFTAASERKVLEHAKEKRHIPFAVDHSSSKPYLCLLIRLVVSHCKTFAQTGDFAAILAELNAQISAHENRFNGVKSQPELTVAETSQQPDYESSSERSVSTSNSTQNANPYLRDEIPQYAGANSASGISNTKQQQLVSAAVSAMLTSEVRLPKQEYPSLQARQSLEALPEQGLASNYANASAACILCASIKQFNQLEKEGHVLQHLGQGAASRSDHHNPEAFFTDFAATWQRCFPASGELAGTEMPASVEYIVAMQQGHVTGGLANDLNRFIAQQRQFQFSRKERPCSDGRRSSSINAADVIARNQLTSVAEDMDADGLHVNAVVLHVGSHAVTPARTYECQICSALVTAKSFNLKYHAMRKHFAAPQKVFECSKCGYGRNEWPSFVTAHVKRVHRGQKGKSVRVIDRSATFTNDIHACLEACFPRFRFAPPPSKGAADKNNGYHHAADSEAAAGRSPENPPEFDLPGPSGYQGPERGPSQKFRKAGKGKPSFDGFD